MNHRLPDSNATSPAAFASTSGSSLTPLERWLAALLKGGTWVASLTIAAGLILLLPDVHAALHRAALPPGMPIVTAGIALFILLPVLRLMLMLGVFLQLRDYRYSAITALVLLIVAAGCAVGAHPG
jgi:uncharacterized membrane protein